MDAPTAIQTLTAFQVGVSGTISGEQTKLDALNYALALLMIGYQSDQQAIADAVVARVGDVQAANTSLTGELASARANCDTKDTEIAYLTKQVADLQIYQAGKDASPDVT